VATIPLTEQIEEVGREVRYRERLYPNWVKLGRLKKDTAETKLAAMQSVKSTLTWLEQNLDWIKPEAERRRAEARAKAERDREMSELSDDPTVQAAKAAFPDAEVADIRPLAEPVEPEETDAP